MFSSELVLAFKFNNILLILMFTLTQKSQQHQKCEKNYSTVPT